MFRRKTVVAQGLSEEKSVYDCLNKLITAQSRVSEQQMRWAKTEENPLFLCLFGRLAELSWMGNELIRQFQDKQTELNRVFRDIEQEEKIVDESRKAFLACKTKCLKLQKQLEHSRKKNDTAKVQSLEIELTTQGSLREHLRQSVETQSHKLELYKIDLVKKGLRSQAETYLEIALNLQALFNAQLRLADMLPLEPLKPTIDDETEAKVSEEMKLFLSQITESLHLYPPANGGINTKKLSASEAGQSPPHHRRSSADEVLVKSNRKSQHSISQPILVGHNQSSPLEDTAQNPPLEAPILEEEEICMVTSGEYCEIESQEGGQETDDEQLYTQTNTSKIPLQALQSVWMNNDNQLGKEKTNRDILKSGDPYKSRESVSNLESLSAGRASLSSAEDLNNERESEPSPTGTPRSVGTTSSDECYADPVDAINEFLQGNEGGISASIFGDSPTVKHPPPVQELTSGRLTPLMKSISDELFPSEQASKELQLQQFHERLFKDSSGGGGGSESEERAGNRRPRNRQHDYSEIEDEPTYSNPFDALTENECRMFKIKAKNQVKRNVSLSSTVVQQSGGPGRPSSPPPPPLPAKDEKMSGFGRRPVRFTRRGSGDTMAGGGGGGTNGNSASPPSGSPALPRMANNIWERREPVWKRKNSGRAGGESPVATQRMVANVSAVVGGGEKPEAPVSVAERLRQLRQRSQSDGAPLDEAGLHSRPPMPLPIPEREPVVVGGRGQVQLNGQTHHAVRTAAALIVNGSGTTTEGGANPVLDMPTKGGKRQQKAWLERTVSEQYQSAYYTQRGRANVVPLSAKEIVKQHISQVAS